MPSQAVCHAVFSDIFIQYLLYVYVYAISYLLFHKAQIITTHTSAKTTPRVAKAEISPKASQGTTKMVVIGGSGIPSVE